MLAVLLAVQLRAGAVDSTYSSPALRELVARIAERNRTTPAALRSYRARVESEIEVVLQRADGLAGTISLEQAQSDVMWRRAGDYEQHLIAYRSRHLAPTPSSLAFLRRAWTIPVLYGDRLSLFFGLDSSRGAPRDDLRQRRPGERGTPAVHPFATDRDIAYRYSGGDTVALIQNGNRVIPIVRVLVEPLPAQVLPAVVVYRGEVDVDAARGEIVRMRGSFVTVTRHGPGRARLSLPSFDVVAFVELENVEIDAHYWVPRYQRIEAHVALHGVGDARSVVRVISHFRSHRANEGASPVDEPLDEPGQAADEPALHVHRLTLAPADSLAGDADWWQPLGAATAGLRADDFLDVGPDAARLTGEPRFELGAPQLADFAHFNRIEGWSTGLAAELRLRDAAPGVTARGNAAWAWSERATRGRVEMERRRGPWITAVHAGRTLDVTNDFRASFDNGPSLLGALVSVDDYDYVDRRSVSLSVGRTLARAGASVRLETGVASDRGVVPHVVRGVFHGDSLFRLNRGVLAGAYARTALVIEMNREVASEFVRPGVGARLSLERGDGSLDWRRSELRVTARRDLGPFSYAARFDAGAVFGHVLPPQQLFELGRSNGLDSYGYKEFAGDRAVVLRGLVLYGLPVWRAPTRVAGTPWLPPLAPALAFGVQSGLTMASSDAATRAIAQLGSLEDRPGAPPAPPGDGTPVSRPTDGVRSSIELGVRVFGGGLGVALRRSVDHRAPWRFGVVVARGM